MQPFEQLIKKKASTLLDECREVKDSFSKSSETIRETYLGEIILRRDALLCTAFDKKAQSMPYYGMQLEMLIKAVKDYASLCNWNFIDLTFLLACIDSVDDTLLEQIAKLSLIYQAFRMIDDLIDGHIDYKGEGTTLYGKLKSNPSTTSQVVTASILPALLMVCEGTQGIDSRYSVLAMNTIWGVLGETLGEPITTLDQYTAMVDGKMVAYGMLLYGPALNMLERQKQEHMNSLMRTTFLCSQIANDLVDRIDDAQRGQPNFWHILEPYDASDHLTGMLSDLYEERQQTPNNLQPYLLSRLYDICNYIIRGLPNSGSSEDA